MPDRLILDTCALVWLATGDTKLTSHIRAEIDAASLVHVSAISAWEISLKAARGQIILPLPPLDWFERALSAHDLRVAELTPAVLVRANELPWHHRDPADRFIIATATLDNLTVVTADDRFRAYDVEVIG